MNHRRRIAMPVVIVAAAWVAAGCGGRSQEEWRSAVNAHCSTYNGRINTALRSSSATPEARAQQLGAIVPILDEFAGKVKAEELPQDGKLEAEAFVNALEATRSAFTDVSEAASAKDATRSVTALRSLLIAGKRSDREARKLGLSSCVNASGASTGGGPGGSGVESPTDADRP